MDSEKVPLLEERDPERHGPETDENNAVVPLSQSSQRQWLGSALQIVITIVSLPFALLLWIFRRWVGDPKQTRQSAGAAGQDSNRYIPPARTSNEWYRCGADLETETSVENSEAVGGTSMVVGYSTRNSKLLFRVVYFPIDLHIPVVAFYSPHESRQIQAKLIHETTGVELALRRCTGALRPLTYEMVQWNLGRDSSRFATLIAATGWPDVSAGNDFVTPSFTNLARFRQLQEFLVLSLAQYLIIVIDKITRSQLDFLQRLLESVKLQKCKEVFVFHHLSTEKDFQMQKSILEDNFPEGVLREVPTAGGYGQTKKTGDMAMEQGSRTGVTHCYQKGKTCKEFVKCLKSHLSEGSIQQSDRESTLNFYSRVYTAAREANLLPAYEITKEQTGSVYRVVVSKVDRT